LCIEERGDMVLAAGERGGMMTDRKRRSGRRMLRQVKKNGSNKN
jgi:hypothetical protein